MARAFVRIVAGTVAPIFIVFAEVIARDVNCVVGDGDGMAEGAPVAVARGSGREIGELRKFPHSGHERSMFGTPHQTNVSVTAIECAPDLLAALACSYFGLR